MGEYSPPGLINVPQFRHAFKKFSIRVSEDQARAMFIKYGCDTQASSMAHQAGMETGASWGLLASTSSKGGTINHGTDG